MYWVTFSLAIALIGISSYIIDRGTVNSTASCVSGFEAACAALDDCELEIIGVSDISRMKQLAIIGLVSAIIFVVIFLIPFNESEVAGI